MTTVDTSQTQESKPTNCISCNKPLKKLKRYYRDGKYYCTKKCWLKMKKGQQTKEA